MTAPFWKKIIEKDPLAFVLTSAFLLRLAILPLFFDDYNYWAFGVFTSFLVGGQNPYRVVNLDPTLLSVNIWRYPPAYLLFTGPAIIAKQLTGQTIVYLALLKIPLAMADVVSTFYLFKILTYFVTRPTALKFASFFAFNPLVVFESSGAGFSDPIPIAFTVISAYYLIRYARRDGPDGLNLSKSALFLGLGVATKIYPLLLLPVLVRDVKGTGRKVSYMFVSLLPVLVMSVPFLLWDARSYISLLSAKNFEGQHPLFPALSLSGFTGPLLLVGFGGLLLLAYVSSLSLTSRLALVFLWVSMVVFGQSLNYMVWGIPFYTLFVAQYRRLFFLQFSPVVTFLVALVYQGSYDGVTGATGVFYWTYHLFHLAIVPIATYPMLVTVELLALGVSVLVVAYFFFSIFARRRLFLHFNTVNDGQVASTRSFRIRRRVLFSLFLVGLVVFSWGYVASKSTFISHQYPVITGTGLSFQDDFRTSFLDYQWVFGGSGSYVLNPPQGTVEIVDSPNGTSNIFRGGPLVVDGFHKSTDSRAVFRFRFDGLLPGSAGTTLANMTDGLLLVRAQPAPPRLLYLDLLNNETVLLSAADNNWHELSARYVSGYTTISLDGANWTRPGGTFSRLILGNTDSRPGFGGNASFSSVDVEIGDFPTGYQSQLASFTSVILPWLFVASLIGPLNAYLSAFVEWWRKLQPSRVAYGLCSLKWNWAHRGERVGYIRDIEFEFSHNA